MQFNSIPNAVRVPFSFVEFSNTEAGGGSVAQPYKLLLIGQKLTAGTQAANSLVRVSSPKQAATLFGAGSMLAAMFRKAYAANNFSEIWCIPLVDDAAGVTAKAVMTVTGPATADGTLAIYIGGELINVPVVQGDAATAIATKIAAAINGRAESYLSAVVDGTDAFKVNLEAKHKGLAANGGPISLNYNSEVTPAGVTVTTTALAGGTTNPDVQDAIDAMGDEQFRTIAIPYTDSGNLALMKTEMARRWGPLLTNDGHLFSASTLGSAALTSLGDAHNHPHLSIVEVSGSPTPSWEVAAVVGAVVCYYSPIDQARPLQTLALPGILAPRIEDRLILQERNVLLYSGIATTTVDSDNNVRIERMITTYKEDPSGNVDESQLDYETMAILSFLRFDFRRFFGVKYPRHKLARDGVRFGTQQPIMTPGLAKAECIGLFAQWEENGLVEDSAQFERDIRVEVNPGNPNRLDFYLPPNLINGLRVLAAQIAFRA